MKSVEDKTWNIFKFPFHEKSISIVTDVEKVNSQNFTKDWKVLIVLIVLPLHL